jgi:integrase
LPALLVFFGENMSLTDIAVKKAVAKDKPYKISDGAGLQLHITPSGGKLWRLAYRHLGKQKSLSIGPYPIVTLAEARLKAFDAKKLINEGGDPSGQKRLKKLTGMAAAVNSFKTVALLWHKHWSSNKHPRYSENVLNRLSNDVFPIIGHRPIVELQAPELVAMVKSIEKRGALEVAKRNYNVCGQIFRFAIAHSYCSRNPCADVRAADFMKPRTQSNFARIPKELLPEFLTKVDAYPGGTLVRLAIRLMSLTFLRTNEFRHATWEEIDFENALWSVPRKKMKQIKSKIQLVEPHLVPLSRQAIETLRALKEISGAGSLIFPGERDHEKPMSENTILAGLKRMGYQGVMTGHGFRGLASTTLHEANFNHKHIEVQLAHIEPNETAGAYNKAMYLNQRRMMMQWWADYLDLARSGNVYPFPQLPSEYIQSHLA